MKVNDKIPPIKSLVSLYLLENRPRVRNLKKTTQHAAAVPELHRFRLLSLKAACKFIYFNIKKGEDLVFANPDPTLVGAVIRANSVKIRTLKPTRCPRPSGLLVSLGALESGWASRVCLEAEGAGVSWVKTGSYTQAGKLSMRQPPDHILDFPQTSKFASRDPFSGLLRALIEPIGNITPKPGTAARRRKPPLKQKYKKPRRAEQGKPRLNKKHHR